jgi:DNA-binding NarL/FixJ family response regulator
MSAPATQVWLIEDNALLAAAVARAIKTSPGFVCDGTFPRCEEALATLDAIRPRVPDIIVLDVGLPGMSGLEGISRLKERAPDSQIVIFTVFDDDEKIYRAICAGASGYLLKGLPVPELIAALEQVALGGSPMTPRIARRVLAMFSKLAPQSSDESSMALSPREKQIVEGMAAGLTNKEIAAKLGLSAHTTDSYTRSIYEKLHVNSRSGAVAKALGKQVFERK